MGIEENGLIDAHLHLQDERLREHLLEIVEVLRKENVTWWGVNGTSPSDWEEVADLADSYSEVYPFFGVHPWKVGSVGESWENDLIGKLKRFPKAGIGEIGLDRWIRNYDLDLQKEVFVRQLNLAQLYMRPVAIHCLRAWGHLLEVFEETGWERPFLLHSYSGPVEMVPKFLERGAYFSISGYFFREEKRPKLELFQAIPVDRLVLETDAPDMLPPQKLRPFAISSPGGMEVQGTMNHPANITAVYEAYAVWVHQENSEVVRRMKDNCDCWIADSLSPGS